MSELNFKIPTEEITLPSQGLLYSDSSPLKSGSIEMKYMTAREEDILTNQNYISKGIVLDKMLESMIVTKINMDDLLLGDKNALLVASRILGYGKDYSFKTLQDGDLIVKEVDLTKLTDKPLVTDTIVSEGKNEFNFKLPKLDIDITFKLLTVKDEREIETEINRIKKLFPEQTPPELTTRLKFIITSVDGKRDIKTIREFVDKHLLAPDAKSLREEYKRVAPDMDLVYRNDGEEDIKIPINLNFFWPS